MGEESLKVVVKEGERERGVEGGEAHFWAAFRTRDVAKGRAWGGVGQQDNKPSRDEESEN